MNDVFIEGPNGMLRVGLDRAIGVGTSSSGLAVTLSDGRLIFVPFNWFPRLAVATPEQLQNYQLIGDGEGIHWPDLDEDISIKGILLGREYVSGAYLKRKNYQFKSGE